MIDFLDELGNFKQKKITLRNVNFFLHFKATLCLCPMLTADT